MLVTAWNFLGAHIAADYAPIGTEVDFFVTLVAQSLSSD
jgi:hypothetical protein